MANTRVEVTLSGIHSRSENTVRVSRDFERGRAGAQELSRAFRDDADALFALQKSYGFSKVSDGQLRWQDPLRPISEVTGGLVISADLSRWFDTNTFYKKPTVVGELEVTGWDRVGSSLIDYRPDQTSGLKNRIAFLPGPYTLASLVDDKFYNSKNELVTAFCKVLEEIVSSLLRSGVSCVQFNEPSLVYGEGKASQIGSKELSNYRRGFQNMLSDLPVELRLHTYFGNSAPIVSQLAGIECITTLGIDFTQTPISELEGSSFNGKMVGCGCVNSRNSLVEDPKWVAEFAANSVALKGASGVTILPSSDLRYLPRDYADRKLKVLADSASLLRRRLEAVQ
ncbi:MAG: hypothetical protein KGH61_02165 [Candidatus Micrarchaeota archaeon]|nr:hypothetical protein [Candidatus Micrarchaeota archaeon]MDE1847733.1 hypothetical protein [Candidatus Micrarchaeota archaeon]MDE1864162.1 hypothetical protein [Candidatus Micrarchaeota archaeon]